MSTATAPVNSALGETALEAFYQRPPDEILEDPGLPEAHEQLLRGLEAGTLRAARRDGDDRWLAVPWVKTALLVGFRAFPLRRMQDAPTPAFDRGAYPPRIFELREGVRRVPGGGAVRRGAHVASGVVLMPPSYVNVGAFLDSGTMVDSHVLVGSCAQIGRSVHLSAGAQIGGVLEPPGALPVVVEDGAFVGAQCGLFEGVVVRQGAVLAPGVQITAATEIFDTVHERRWRGEVPPGAVVVPGSRPARGDYARCLDLHLYAPIIVKHRDGTTNAATALEEALR